MSAQSRLYTLGEEIANSITHGIGALLSVLGMSVLLVQASINADPWHMASAAVFGASLILMYFASTLYHALPHSRVKQVLRVMDHCAIYFLIAGTYTPFLLVNMRGPWGWSLFAFIWGCAIIGCLYKIFVRAAYKHKWMDHISTAIYIMMGWALLVALRPAMELIPGEALLLLLIGGLAYTGGVAFYLWEKLPYNHAIWHLFVLCGSAVHFGTIYTYILRA